MPPYSKLDSNDLNQNTLFLVHMAKILAEMSIYCIVTMANTDYVSKKKKSSLQIIKSINV